MDNLKNDPKICLITKSYSGYIDQNDFIQRYIFIKNRINNSLTREELAFLLGRTPYFTIDYEELSTTTKLDLWDFDQLSLILGNTPRASLAFHTNEDRRDISNEKRIVRVKRSEFYNRIEYDFSHQWHVVGGNNNLKIVEPVIDSANFEDEPVNLIYREVMRLIFERFFDINRMPFDIYRRIWQEYKYKSSAWRVVFLKEVIYRFIREDKLSTDFSKGHFSFLSKNQFSN